MTDHKPQFQGAEAATELDMPIAIIDHRAGTKGFHHFQIRCAADTGNIGAEMPGDLYGIRANATRA